MNGLLNRWANTGYLRLPITESFIVGMRRGSTIVPINRLLLGDVSHGHSLAASPFSCSVHQGQSLLITYFFLSLHPGPSFVPLSLKDRWQAHRSIMGGNVRRTSNTLKERHPVSFYAPMSNLQPIRQLDIWWDFTKFTIQGTCHTHPTSHIEKTLIIFPIAGDAHWEGKLNRRINQWLCLTCCALTLQYQEKTLLALLVRYNKIHLSGQHSPIRAIIFCWFSG